MTNLLFSRRLFLSRGSQLLSAAATLPMFLDRSAAVMAAEYAANPQGVGRPDRILVIVQLAGGNDGLSTIIPIRNDDYYRARPRLAVKADTALKLTDDMGVHPQMAGFKKLYDAGEMAIMQCVGYPNHNRSHFRSTDIWQTAEPEKTAKCGWLGRYFDNNCPGADPGPASAKAADPNKAIALVAEPPTSLVGEHFIPLTFRSPNDLQHMASSRDDKMKTAFEKLNSDIGLTGEMMDGKAPSDQRIVIPRGQMAANPATRPAGDDDFLQRSALNARVYADSIRKTVANVRNMANYPQSPFAQQLKIVAQMIASGMPTRVYYTQLGGFDTHSGQAQRHDRLMQELSASIAAFMQDLKALGQLDRTAVMTFSEFGRRVAENGSQGTDHGEAAPLFVFGSDKMIKPGFHGEAPDLRPGKLSRGDVAFKMDFRSVYASVLSQWLRTDDQKVLQNKFPQQALFQAGKVG
jgi:uncharacterized protein (DUF1501 family)